jgi:hypothetical protein
MSHLDGPGTFQSAMSHRQAISARPTNSLDEVIDCGEFGVSSVFCG